MKRFFKFLHIAIATLFQNKTRSLLTMLGVTIGIGSVILMISVGKGAESLILSSVQSFGSRSIFIQPGGGTSGGPPSLTSIDKVKYKDYLALKNLDSLEDVTPLLTTQAAVTYQNDSLKTTIVGTSESYANSINVGVAKGRFIEPDDVFTSRRVIDDSI